MVAHFNVDLLDKTKADNKLHRNSVTNREPRSSHSHQSLQNLEAQSLSRLNTTGNIKGSQQLNNSNAVSGSIPTLMEEGEGAPIFKHNTVNLKGGNTVKQKLFGIFSRRTLKSSQAGAASIQDLSGPQRKLDFRAVNTKEELPMKSITESKKLVNASAFEIRENVPKQPAKGLDDYYIIRRVGKGGFATVFLIRLKTSTGRYFALKAIKKQEVVRLKQDKQIMNEKNILTELKHPLLVDLYHTFQSPSNLFLVMEYVAGGDLFTLLRRSKVYYF